MSTSWHPKEGGFPSCRPEQHVLLRSGTDNRIAHCIVRASGNVRPSPSPACRGTVSPIELHAVRHVHGNSTAFSEISYRVHTVSSPASAAATRKPSHTRRYGSATLRHRRLDDAEIMRSNRASLALNTVGYTGIAFLIHRACNQDPTQTIHPLVPCRLNPGISSRYLLYCGTAPGLVLKPHATILNQLASSDSSLYQPIPCNRPSLHIEGFPLLLHQAPSSCRV